MRSRNMRRGMAAAAALLGTGLVLAGCGGDGGGSNDVSGTWPGDGKAECKGLEQLADFGDLTGKTVSVYTSILPPEQKTQEDSYKLFTTCTGANVKYEGSDQFETQLVVRVKAGNAPDIAYIPQPGLLKTVVVLRSGRRGAVPGRRQRRQVVRRGLEGLRHRRRQVLRRPAGREREVVRLVLAEDVRQERLDRSPRRGTT